MVCVHIFVLLTSQEMTSLLRFFRHRVDETISAILPRAAIGEGGDGG